VVVEIREFKLRILTVFYFQARGGGKNHSPGECVIWKSHCRLKKGKEGRGITCGRQRDAARFKIHKEDCGRLRGNQDCEEKVEGKRALEIALRARTVMRWNLYWVITLNISSAKQHGRATGGEWPPRQAASWAKGISRGASPTRASRDHRGIRRRVLARQEIDGENIPGSDSRKNGSPVFSNLRWGQQTREVR